MSERDATTDGIERRSVLAAVATGLGGVGVARRSLAGAQDANQYVVEQGDRCVPVTPISGDETVAEFYDYRTPNTDPSGDAYSSYGTTDLQRPETSICFLYDGPDGLSLVVVHDALRDGTGGGAATFDLRFENPHRGSWVVGDDDYDAPSNYDTWERTDDGWRIDWTWAEGRSDGGVYRPLGDEFAVTIDPAFNEDATLHGEYYEGDVTDWELLTGDRSDPERVSLALDRPLVIRTGSCRGNPTTTTTRETTTEADDTTTEDDSQADQPQEPIRADVEVVPGRVNPRSQGRLPVVVYSSTDFDATTLARGSVAFGPSDATPVQRTRTDEDDDGRADLKLHFRQPETGIDWDTDRVQLTGETESGRTVEGEAGVQLVPGGNDEDDGDAESDDGEEDDGDEGDDEDYDDDDESEERDDERAEDGDDDDGNDDDDDDDDGDDGEREEADDDRGDSDDGSDDDGDDSNDTDDNDGSDDAEDEEDEDSANEDADDDDREADDDDERGRGNGTGRENGGERGNGGGNGNGNGNDGENRNGRGNGNGNGQGNGAGRYNGGDRGNGRGSGRDDRNEDD
jgi:hypothetical protein